MSDGIFDRARRSRANPPAEERPGSGTDAGLLRRRDAGSSSSGSRRIAEMEVLAAVDRVPALPAVVYEILELVGNEGTSAHDLEVQVEQDMVIAGRLLKLVNSAFYGLPNPINSLQQAVAIVGFGSLRSLVLAASAAGLLRVRLDGYGYTEAGLWKNAAVTASLAKAIALRSGRDAETADEYFLAGLLRDIGMLVLGPFLDRHDIELRADPDYEGDIITRERACLGHDHCRVGGHIASKWQLPGRLGMVITRHHRIPKDSDEADLHLLAVVRLAERLANKACVGLVKDHPFERGIDTVLIRSAGIDAESLKAVVAQVATMSAEAETFEA